MFKIVGVALALTLKFVLASVSLAEGRTGDGKCRSIALGSAITEGTTGVIVHNTASDSWYNETAAEGKPTAAMATCRQRYSFQRRPKGTSRHSDYL